MIPLDQLTVAELRDICRQHGLPESYDADQMRHDIRRPHRSDRPTNQ
jgi:hypothetical protein